MIASGLLKEVGSLLSNGFKSSLPPLQSLGYKELATFLEDRSGVASIEAAIEEIKQKTRRFAKRQLTWFRADKEISWLDIHGKSAVDIAQQIVRDIGIRLPIQT
jgi:tRNA dimethylallyltransferase